jgi:S-adenosylmethionine hydrolase
VDISHSVQAFDILDGALAIAPGFTAISRPERLHMVVVDPGVGSARRPIIASSDRHHFVAPEQWACFR